MRHSASSEEEWTTKFVIFLDAFWRQIFKRTAVETNQEWSHYGPHCGTFPDCLLLCSVDQPLKGKKRHWDDSQFMTKALDIAPKTVTLWYFAMGNVTQQPFFFTQQLISWYPVIKSRARGERDMGWAFCGACVCVQGRGGVWDIYCAFKFNV